MEHFIDEKTVMQFYLDQIADDKIIFLQKKPELKEQIKDKIEALIKENKMNNKLQIATELWKKLFEGAMSYISDNKKGYDKIFKYFDSYVEFEELIFASDSFYRDHTLHCLWVYFLGEYIKQNQEFDKLFTQERKTNKVQIVAADIADELDILNEEDLRAMKRVSEMSIRLTELYESSRCIAALTHDLGYPLKKIEKINKSIKKVLPYFAINNFNDFKFEYENIQQEFVNQFIDFISRSYDINFKGTGELQDTFLSIWNNDGNGHIIGYNEAAIKNISPENKEKLKRALTLELRYHASFSKKASYYNDFENYKHGIMSAFLLMKNLQAFQDIDYNYYTDSLNGERAKVLALQNILTTIADHTSEGYTIDTLNSESFLTFVDELEEFSRISRASQNREYVEEFCDTALYMEDGWLNVIFEFNNTSLDNLDPEISFKGRCKRFLSLFNVPHLDDILKIRVTVVGKLPSDENVYILEIARKHADIIINGESKNIPKYLKSTQYYTKEEYAEM